MDRNLKKRIIEFRDKIGRDELLKRLLKNGISLTMAQKLLVGCYPYQPKIDKILAIEKAMSA